ncbi:DUF4062 domain-containing protein [Pseudomonas sp. CCOS 191]|uniref:DUF4062 domain-containing protein n=1 Tax=Pseudomonas sp. CCOS 191 TaxID=1649877 RepID=UPI0006249B10|nr:DUF4062 domain-containing protein [Pseudomonas sp. CCOS 191]CRI59148.1 hypothetical protein CCOS191_4612 [Pseudomonas sp. CCOS 191]
MASKLRAFISSTMQDLGNERRAVVKRLAEMGLEPVHAETMPSSTTTSWATLRQAIEESHLFILILGDRYGWVPDSGYGAESGKSVTHLEFEAAKAANKPMLVFTKRLPYASSYDPANKQRDDFREEVAHWNGGVFRREFEWADDLAAHVGESITELWTNALARQLIQEAEARRPSSTPLPAVAIRPLQRSGRVLIAGAGMSVAAGYPTAQLLMEAFARDLWEGEVSEVRYSFSELAGYYQAKFGASRLQQRVLDFLNTPQTVLPTLAHLRAVVSFPVIVTTNYDLLFERACEFLRIPYRVVQPHDALPDDDFEGLTLYKIVGSASDPSSLIITSADLPSSMRTPVFESIRELVKRHELVVIGHSLRDSNVQQLLGERGERTAIHVSPSEAPGDDVLISLFGLKRVIATADQFMASYEPV